MVDARIKWDVILLHLILLGNGGYTWWASDISRIDPSDADEKWIFETRNGIHNPDQYGIGLTESIDGKE